MNVKVYYGFVIIKSPVKF